MASNKNAKKKKLLEYFGFPTIILLGFFLFVFTMLISNESTLGIMSLVTVGGLLIFLGVALYIQSFFRASNIIGVSGYTLYVLAVLVSYLIERQITYTVAVLYALGAVLLLWSIVANFKPLSAVFSFDEASERYKQRSMLAEREEGRIIEAPDPYARQESISIEDKIDVELGEVAQKLQHVYAIYQGNKRGYEMQLVKAKRERKRLLRSILEIKEFFERILADCKGQETEMTRRIRIKCYEMKEQLEENGVRRMITKEQDSVDVKKHFIVNDDEQPREWPSGRIPKIKTVARPGYFVDSEILRVAYVEADWR